MRKLAVRGYLLPLDQLAYWALVIGSNIAQSPKERTDIFGVTKFFDIGGFQKELFLGGLTPGAVTLIRVYLLHITVLPIALFIFLGVHFWRIRKDGGLEGSKLIKIIKKSRPRIPLIIISSGNSKEELARVLEQGVYYFIIKLINGEELKEAVDSGLKISP